LRLTSRFSSTLMSRGTVDEEGTVNRRIIAVLGDQGLVRLIDYKTCHMT
jgi:hypothetical protein